MLEEGLWCLTYSLGVVLLTIKEWYISFCIRKPLRRTLCHCSVWGRGTGSNVRSERGPGASLGQRQFRWAAAFPFDTCVCERERWRAKFCSTHCHPGQIVQYSEQINCVTAMPLLSITAKLFCFLPPPYAGWWMIEFQKQVGWVPNSYLKKCPKLEEEEDVLGLLGSCEFARLHGTASIASWWPSPKSVDFCITAVGKFMHL